MIGATTNEGGMHMGVFILNHISTEENQRGTTEKLNGMDETEIQMFMMDTVASH